MERLIENSEKIPKKEIFETDNKEVFDIFKKLDKQKVTNYVIKQVTDGKVSMLTFGKQGEIYKVALPSESGGKYVLVAKKKKDILDAHYDLRKEFRLHQQAYEANTHQEVKIPKLFGYQELPNGEQFVVMEFIPDQTIYTLLLNKVVEKNKPQRASAKDDREADINILKIFGLEKTKFMLSKIETTPYIYSDIKGMKLFTREQGEKIKKNIKEFLENMHKRGIYHRDLGANIRNIMVGSDGKISILDFGKAISCHAKKNNTEIYKEVTEDAINVYAHDEEILDIIEAYTEK